MLSRPVMERGHAPWAAAPPWRRHKTAAERRAQRRAQRLRADARAISRLLRAVGALHHHGGRPSGLCRALEEALAAAARGRRPGDGAAATPPDHQAPVTGTQPEVQGRHALLDCLACGFRETSAMLGEEVLARGFLDEVARQCEVRVAIATAQLEAAMRVQETQETEWLAGEDLQVEATRSVEFSR